jgi:hypothetical protein
MKFNFKKITAIAASALMMGMTMGVAAATNFPSPYSTSTSDGVAIVSGSGTGVDDATATESINTYLKTKVTAGVGGTATGGDSFLIESGSTKLNLNDAVSDVWTTTVTDDELGDILIDGEFTNDENTAYAYTQEVTFGGALSFTHFAHSLHNDQVPDLGFNLAPSAEILNYSLDFTTDVESDSVSGDLVDIETRDLMMLGRNYYVLDLGNQTDDAKLTLLDAANSATLNEGEEKTLTVNGIDYEVSINFITTNTVKLDINGEITNSLIASATQKLKDGAYLGIKEINVQDYAGGIKTVEFSIGSGKLEIENGSQIEFNDNAIEDLTGYLRYSTSTTSSKQKLDKIEITWKLDDRAFMTANTEMLMPGFEVIKLNMGGLTLPKQEKIYVEYSGSDKIKLKVPIKDGTVTIPLFKMSTTTGNFTLLGEDTTQRLATTNNTKLFYDAYNTNKGFIASWNNSKDSESYWLDVSVKRDSKSQGYTNRTTFTNLAYPIGSAGRTVCKDKTEGQICKIGNVQLTLTNIDYQSSTSKNVNLTINDGGSFQKLYTVEGLAMYLPVGINNGTVTGKSMLDFVNHSGQSGNVESSIIWFEEENKEGTLGAGEKFNITIAASSSTATSRKASVTQMNGFNSDDGVETNPDSNSEIYEAMVNGELATKILWDKSSTSQYDIEITYHGEEVSANVYLSSPGVTVGEMGNMVFLDTDTASWKDRDVILVGGSCINSATAAALGHTYPTCGSAFGIDADQYIIQSVAGSAGGVVNAGKIALVVAGYAQADTAAAASMLIETPGAIDTAAGKKYLGVVGTAGDSTVTSV